MSWSVSVTGNAEEIGKAFDAQREQSASWGMIEAEQRDIDEARDLAMHFASKYNRVGVSASGHWNLHYRPESTEVSLDCSTFGRVAIALNADVDDETGKWATERVHRRHLCKESDGGCGNVWMPSNRFTVGVRELPLEVGS